MRRVASCAAAIAIAVCACQQDGSTSLLARIDITPASIPEGDGFATPVLLDGRRSTPIDPDAGSGTMTWAWRILDTADGYRVAPADEQPPGCAAHMVAPCLLVRFAGDHPVTVELTVHESGSESTTRQALSLTVL